MQDRNEQTIISMVGDRSSYIVDVQAKVQSKWKTNHYDSDVSDDFD